MWSITETIANITFNIFVIAMFVGVCSGILFLIGLAIKKGMELIKWR